MKKVRKKIKNKIILKEGRARALLVKTQRTKKIISRFRAISGVRA